MATRETDPPPFFPPRPMPAKDYKALLDLMVFEAKAEAVTEVALNLPDMVPSQMEFLRDRIAKYKKRAGGE